MFLHIVEPDLIVGLVRTKIGNGSTHGGILRRYIKLLLILLVFSLSACDFSLNLHQKLLDTNRRHLRFAVLSAMIGHRRKRAQFPFLALAPMRVMYLLAPARECLSLLVKSVVQD